jgi:hypothetical protein
VALLLPAAAFAQATPPPDPTQPTTDDPANPSLPPDTVPDPNVPLPETTPTPVPTPPPAEDQPTYRVVDHQYRTTTTEQPSFYTRYGVALSAGGGVSGFTDTTARDSTNDGGGWDVRAVIGTRSPLAAEISYIGSAQSINALGLDNDAVLLGNGVQADLRLNATTSGPFQPFIFAGAAWRRYDLTNTQTNTSDISDSDDVVEFPVGAGVAYHYQGFIVDARGEFRAATNEDLMPSLSNDITQDSGEASLHRWGVNATVGYEF